MLKYEDVKGVIHSCDSSQIVPNDRSTKLVWTKCNKDVPANKGFKGADSVTCKACIAIMQRN